MVALEGSDESHVTEVVRSWIVPSEKCPVAVNCWVVPLAMLGSIGAMSSDVRVALVTVRVVKPETAPNVALIVVCPGFDAVALPEELMVATLVADELQATDRVRSRVV